jgi:hypothetical protein
MTPLLSELSYSQNVSKREEWNKRKEKEREMEK